MSNWPAIELEDTFGDCLRKALRGNRMEAEALGERTGIASTQIDAWLADHGTADEKEALSIARALHLDAEKFAARAAGSWYPPVVASAQVRRHSQHPHPSNGYVYDLGDGKAALVDPAGAPAHLLDAIREAKADLQYILITHKHDDHCDAAGAVAAVYPNATVVMHPLDAHAIGSLASTTLPDAGPIAMLHTPGHTDGSVCYFIGDVVFTGDTLFAGSVGGAYGDKSTYADILRSIRAKLFALPRDTKVMPGHGPPTSIALERAHNSFFDD